MLTAGVDITTAPCIVAAYMSHIDRSSFLDFAATAVQRPAISRRSVLAGHVTPVDHLFSVARLVAPPPPPPQGLVGPRWAYSSELTPRSRTACPFPNLSVLQSKTLGTEGAPAASAPRTGPAVRRQVSGAEARLDQPTDAMPPSAVAAEPAKPLIPANARPRRTDSRSVPSRCAQIVVRERNSSWVRLHGRYDVQAGVPAQWARSHVRCLIWADENGDSTFTSDEYVTGPWLDQQTNNGGWQSLGVHTLQGRVRIGVRVRRARDDYRDIGLANASLAIDVFRLRKVRSQ